jgi:hypothetical protein
MSLEWLVRISFICPGKNETCYIKGKRASALNYIKGDEKGREGRGEERNEIKNKCLVFVLSINYIL